MIPIEILKILLLWPICIAINSNPLPKLKLTKWNILKDYFSKMDIKGEEKSFFGKLVSMPMSLLKYGQYHVYTSG